MVVCTLDWGRHLLLHLPFIACMAGCPTAVFGIFVMYVGIIGNGYFCSERAFSEDIHSLIATLVPATRKLWQKTKVGMQYIHSLQYT